MVTLKIDAGNPATKISSSWLGDFRYRVKLTIPASGLGSNLTQFPFAINISSTAGTGTTDLTGVLTELGENYAKMALTTSDGFTQLPVEVEAWDTGNSRAWLWSSANLSSVADNVFYLYYDSRAPDNDTHVGWTGTVVAQTVWDANFVGVWHMADKPGDANTVLDSTSNGNDGAKQGGMGVAAWGDVGMAQTFDGTDDCIRCLDSDSLDTPTAITIESAVYPTASVFVITEKDYTTSIEFHNKYDKLQLHGKFGGVYYSNFILTTGNVVSLNNLNSLSVTYDSTTAYLYAQGVSVPLTQAGSGAIGVNGDDLLIGARLEGHYGGLFGRMSELRISNIARSDEWIAATHLSNTDALVGYSLTAPMLTPIRMSGA